MIEELLKTLDIEYNTKEVRYEYNGIPVPRCSAILSSMLHEDYLMEWANSIGLYKRQKYKEVLNKAANIGTYSHELVENYINNQEYNINKLGITSKMEYDSVINAVESFKLWYNDVFSMNEVEILGMEEKLSCPWFGGTYDLLIKINGRIYLGDFKTSNHIGYKYCLQLAAYRYLLKLNKNIDVDGCIILQLDKKTPSYTEYIIDLSNNIHSKFMDDCLQCYFSLVYAYFQRINIERQFKTIF